jgi:hypothetical protein
MVMEVKRNIDNHKDELVTLRAKLRQLRAIQQE